MTEILRTNLLILGSGPAGCTAAVYGARAMLKPLVLCGSVPGGQLTITTDVENWPGDATVLGPNLMSRMDEHARAAGAELVSDHATAVDFSKRPFEVEGSSGNRYLADAVVLATGAQANWLGLASESEFLGFGVSACATCDGFFFRDQNVVVVGGGNTAVEEALYLANIAKRVYLVHRRDSLRAEKILQDRLLTNSKIVPLWNHTVREVIGADNPRRVTAVRLHHAVDKTNKVLNCDGVFIAIGHSPASEIFSGQIDMTDSGYITTAPGRTSTSVAGVFAAGDLIDPVYRQAVTSAGSGCMAALDAERFLSAKPAE